MIEYFKQVRAELKHVAWPTPRQTTVFTAVVALVSIAVAIYLGLLDYVFALFIQRII